jgi:uncharacterized protein involved in outer membrane biogenesis
VQTTLLGLAIAIILAIVAALVAPLVVDWNAYRAAFETEASRLTGMSVRVNGAIDARILPSPHITLHDVAVGEAGGQPRLRAGMLDLEVGLGPLLRGEVQASEAHLVSPQLSIGLDRSGAIDWPALSPSFHPDALSISHFTIEDGRVTVTDAASGSRLALLKLSFSGDIRSFLGPFSGAGTFVAGDERYSYRISGARAASDSGLKVRLAVDPADHPLTADIDGIVSLDRNRPKFDGTLALARPAGAALANGVRVMSDPWRAAGKILATPAAVSLRDVAFRYGPDESPLDFTGRADLTFGDRPHLDGAVSATQLDVDRALADPDATHRPPLLVFKSLLETFVAVAAPPVPADVAVGVDAVTLGGTAIDSVHGKLRYDGGAWSLNDFQFHAPGLTQVKVSGRLEQSPQGFAFNGPATVESADFGMLLAWLRGGSERPSGQAKAMSAQGVITIGGDHMAVDGLTASLDQENVAGRLAYTWAVAGHPAMLDAELQAASLDLDTLAAFGKTAAGYGLELPRRGSLLLDIGRATSTGVDARAINARLKFDGGALQIDRLSIGELGGAALDISGRVDELSSQPRGRIALDLEASALAGLSNVVGKFAPRAADALHSFAGRLAPAKVHAVLAIGPDAAPGATSGSTAKLDLDGQLGLIRLKLNGEATGESDRLGAARLRIDSRLDADDATRLTTLFGLDRVIALDPFPGDLTLSVEGPLDGDLRVDGQVAASGLTAAIRGALRLHGDKPPTGALHVQASAADLRPLAQALTGQSGTAAPVMAQADLGIAGTDLSFTQIAASVGAASLHGRLNLDLSSPIVIDGDVDAAGVDAAAVAAMLLGLPRGAPDAGAIWSGQSLGSGAFTAMNGAVTFKLDHADFTPALVARHLQGTVRFHPAEIAVDALDGDFAGGHLTGDLAFRRNADLLDANGRIELAGADLATIIGSDNKSIDGKLTVELQCDSIGGSPIDLVRALNGSGTIALADTRVAGLDVAAFDAAMRAADQSDKIDAKKVQAVVSAAMANGRLAVPQGNAAVTIAGGKVIAANATLPAGNADLLLTGGLDLSNAIVDGRATLVEHPAPNALIRMPAELQVALKGPLPAPARMLDTSALTSWLTLRAAELQTRRLESIEANQRLELSAAVGRPDFSAIRKTPSGGLLETALPLNSLPDLGTRELDRMQPLVPPTAPRNTATIAPKPRVAPPQPSAQAVPPPAEAAQSAPPPTRSLFQMLFGQH